MVGWASGTWSAQESDPVMEVHGTELSLFVCLLLCIVGVYSTTIIYCSITSWILVGGKISYGRGSVPQSPSPAFASVGYRAALSAS